MRRPASNWYGSRVRRPAVNGMDSRPTSLFLTLFSPSLLLTYLSCNTIRKQIQLFLKGRQAAPYNFLQYNEECSYSSSSRGRRTAPYNFQAPSHKGGTLCLLLSGGFSVEEEHRGARPASHNWNGLLPILGVATQFMSCHIVSI